MTDDKNDNDMENINFIMLEHLKALRLSHDQTEKRMDELVTRIGHIDTKLASIKSDIAQLHTIGAEHSNAFDKIGQRLKRIESRLDLVEA